MDHTEPNYPVLLVDDQAVNLTILRHILEPAYTVVCASDGGEALSLLAEHHGEFSAIVLDLIMPGMDGYEFLRRKAEIPEYRDLPVLVATGTEESAEDECLSLGAWDYISKPYRPTTVKLRLASIIARGEQALSRRLAYVSAHDPLTGLLNRQAFSREMTHICRTNPARHFTLIRLDINRFGLINSLYGVAEGNALLQHLAHLVKAAADAAAPAVCGRISGDIFCLCVPCEGSALTRLITQLQKGVAAYPSHYYLEPTIGVYHIENAEQDPELCFRRATLAAASCKNNYQHHVAYYSEALTAALATEQAIANEMESALASGQFQMYLQPKVDMQQNRICGAEALVRWEHPTRGRISPDAFVPIFEKNGFIPLLDHFMWEQVCIQLRRWLDAGIPILPVSVNVSRQNLYDPALVRELAALVQKYKVPPALMQLELTESAYMDAPEQMIRIVKRLRKNGFTILMDDFGSKYSSLNALKDIPVDIIKLDYAFLAPGPNTARGKTILRSMLQMADALGLPAIVEGVETKSQIDFLRGIGCRYAQGFFYAKALPVAEYEALLLRQAPDAALAPAAT